MYGARLVRAPIEDGLTAPVEARYSPIRSVGIRGVLLGSGGLHPGLTVRRRTVTEPNDAIIQGALHAAAQLRLVNTGGGSKIDPRLVRRRRQRGIL